MSNPIDAGYMGIASLGGKTVRVTSFGVNLEQNVTFYDHTIGLRDSVPANLLSSKGDSKPGGSNLQKSIYRPSTIGVSGNIAFPLQSGEENALFNEAKTGDDFRANYTYACDGASLSFYACKVNSYTLNLTAGDICNASASIVAINAADGGGPGLFSTSKKLITWDAVKITGFPSTDIMSFTMTINNNCSNVYTAGQNKARNLRPADIRVGIQSVTGSAVVYGNGDSLSQGITTKDNQNIGVTIGSLSFNLDCVFLPIKREGGTGAFVTTIAFVGVGKHFT